jgi:alpha 1,3-mannosyltransferase
LGCSLPIEIYYNGPKDLDKELIDILHDEEGVSVVDVSGFLPPLLRNSISGWGIKPLAMLVSSFQEFVFIDADGNF